MILSMGNNKYSLPTGSTGRKCEKMKKTMVIYWEYEDVEYTGFADYDGERIRFCNGSPLFEGDTYDCVEQSDCEDGITLDMIWEDLESACDDDGRLNATDIDLI